MGCSGDGHAHGGSECERSTRRGVEQPDGPLKARAGGRGAPSVLDDEAHLSFRTPPSHRIDEAERPSNGAPWRGLPHVF